MRWTRWLWLAVAACSSTAGAPSHPIAPTGTRDVTAPSSPSDAECDELLAHAVALGLDDLRATTPPDRLPTDADQAELRTALHRELGDACRALSRSSYQCGMAAKTTVALSACHSTRSSSTSKISVAPGGIAPPAAPRSP